MGTCDYLDIGLGAALGLTTALVGVIVFLYRRFRILSSIDLKLYPPAIPRIVLLAIEAAEAEHYRSQPLWRRAVEILQDMLTFLSPGLVYKLNFSVGRYRIKPKTIDGLIQWSIRSNFLRIHRTDDRRLRALIAYFSHQPAINDWQISVYLEKLRREHPALGRMDWAEIGESDELIAKLYSGYMGAGGDWGAWKGSVTPGTESKKRLQYHEPSNQYQLIQRLRAQPPRLPATGAAS